MRVNFRRNQLRQAFEEAENATRRWGTAVARKYVQRVEALLAANSFEDIKSLRSFRAHPLAGEREGQWGIDLTGRWRLILVLAGDEKTVTIEEVTNHYGD